ncbi:hypothetical protein AB0469_22770 [Streptomyces sp. NPDC093801]|uniref:hypothetical protein n=1 Tax=Streptomyces sp. NPDC093801 TaxID=3155203 RepID=UPI00344DE6CE
MTGRWERARVARGRIDPEREWRPPPARAADEARSRHLPVRPVLTVPPGNDAHHADGTPGRTDPRRVVAEGPDQAGDRIRERRPEPAVATDLREGLPAEVIARLITVPER